MNCCDDKTPQGQEKTGVARLLQRPRSWMLIGAVVVAGGLAMGWDQMVLLGIAPILISLLPCLVMCGLGVCMMCKNKGGKSTGQGEASSGQDATAAPAERASNHSQPAEQKVATEQGASRLQA